MRQEGLPRADEMVQGIKMLATKTDGLRCIPELHVAEENFLPQSVPQTMHKSLPVNKWV